MVGEDILRRRCREVTAFGTPELSRLVDESEGCLSVPGPYRVVPRPDRAVVRGRDQDGEPLIIDGRAARLGTWPRPGTPPPPAPCGAGGGGRTS
ncbi:MULTISPECIES: peptide deformylase [unclassified Streptomyces]|uniref:peptide deformylase n=1 Tax=unclassified Streptomyces TaxID=2593676 RepID=UPI00215662BF|nr:MULTISPECIES: peptide deformylase [unclassified Streptomyces]